MAAGYLGRQQLREDLGNNSGGVGLAVTLLRRIASQPLGVKCESQHGTPCLHKVLAARADLKRTDFEVLRVPSLPR